METEFRLSQATDILPLGLVLTHRRLTRWQFSRLIANSLV
jgi:hypothetical protein